MENTKNCPYCGQEILNTAKKCKHCGKWLEKKCPQCGEWIKAEAKKCRFCGSWFNKWEKEKYERSTNFTSTTSNMEDLQEAIEREKEEKQTTWLIYIECAVVLILFGIGSDCKPESLVTAGFLCYMLLNIRMLRVLYCFGISFIWGIIGLAIAPILMDDTDLDTAIRILENNQADYWWVGILFGLGSLLFHWPAMRSEFNKLK